MPLRRLLPSLLVLAACAGARGPAAPAPTPGPAAPTAPAEPTVVTQAPPITVQVGGPAPDWHLLDPATDRVPGTGAARALRELLQNAAPKRTVVVAVIDGGVDTAHAALRPSLWTNADERAGNRTDDDRNGYVDDVRGWNFIGGADGRNIDHERLEITRLVVRCRAGEPSPVATSCPVLIARFDSIRSRAAAQAAQYEEIGAAVDSAVQTLARALGIPADSLTPARVSGMQPATEAVRRARSQYLFLANAGATPAELREARTALTGRVRYELNPDFDPRPIVGDTPAQGRRYGNPDVTGPDASHGSHVAGIIAAAAGQGTRGIAPGAVIMGVRAVPNGDERDKDVANAIRYAVDNGAHIINMSFGKGYSPEKATVDSAVRYAESKGVLLVHAAGNDGDDADRNPSYPIADYVNDAGRAATWLEVGASSWNPAELAAPFSNYGKRRVDLFAPGVDILSTVPGGTWKREDGTSMAAPVVSGVAALLMQHFPTLTAAEVKRILLATVTPQPGRVVPRPGGDGRVPFADLSATGGVVNAYAAVKMAQAMTKTAQ